MEQVLHYEEEIVLRLRALYERSGYRPYRMSEFEEYDLYAQNKRFLVSQNVLTFTDTSGRLMALKPDVTLSIAKNCRLAPGEMEKVCYDESVYRAPGGEREFREITQTGLECLGEVDDYAIGEVVLLAARSLGAIRESYVLDVSHVGFLEGLLAAAELDEGQSAALLRAVGRKSAADIAALCGEYRLPEGLRGVLGALTALHGPMGDRLPELRSLCVNNVMRSACCELEQLWRMLEGRCPAGSVKLDFSITGESEYYNGVVFKGYVDGVPSAVLSGGRYDRLMERLGKRAGAIGFAVYLDLLERLEERGRDYDADVLLTYGDGADCLTLLRAAEALEDEGLRVRVQRHPDGRLRCRRQMRLGADGRPEEARDA